MKIRTGLTRAEADELLRIKRKLGEESPARGTHVGSGPHVKMPDTWDGTGKVPPGWSGVHGVYEETEQVEETVDGARVVSTRGLGTYAVGLSDDVSLRLSRDGDTRLTAAEKAFLEAEEVGRSEPVGGGGKSEVVRGRRP